MTRRWPGRSVWGATLMAPLAAELAGTPAARVDCRASRDTVVFVCEHGSVKSAIARLWFERLAAERGSKWRAASRGVTPEAEMPEAVAANLKADGLDPAGFRPQAVEPRDFIRAARIVAIGVDPASLGAPADVPVESWSDIPPATRDYPAAREALRARIGELLERLTPPRSSD